MLTDQEIGRKVELARHEIDLTQKEVAKEIGVTTVMISRYERGINIISPLTLQKLSRVLKKPVSYFFGEQSLSGVRELLHSVLPSPSEDDYSLRQSVSVPYLDELFPMNVLDQIALTTKRYALSERLDAFADSSFAIHTSSINSADIDIAINTTIVVCLTSTPINGDKILLFSKSNIHIRNYFRINGNVQYISANPILGVQALNDKSATMIGVIIAIEKKH